MQNLQIGIEEDSGSMIDFNIDSEIIKGLYVTLETSKIKENIKNCNIHFINSVDEVITKVTKINNVAIATVKIDEDNMFQYLVGSDMNLSEMLELGSKDLPSNIKELLEYAYGNATGESFSDF